MQKKHYLCSRILQGNLKTFRTLRTFRTILTLKTLYNYG